MEGKLLLEKRELPHYELTIIVNRHGPRPKDDDAGLSTENKEEIFNRRLEEYDGFDLNHEKKETKKRIIASPKLRAKETAEKSQEALLQYGDAAVSIETDTRLTEGGMDYYNKLVKENPSVDWFRQWYTSKDRPNPDVKLGWEVAASYAQFILDEIKRVKEEGGKQENDTYSHAPAMAAFILTLEDKLGVSIIPEGLEKEDRLDPKRLSRIFPLMDSFFIRASSHKPDMVNLFIHGKSFDIPIGIIKEISDKK